MRLLALLLLGSPILALAQDTRLDAIRAILLPMRQLEPLKARGATPAFTTVKHQLRDWIESRLSVLETKPPELLSPVPCFRRFARSAATPEMPVDFGTRS